MMEKLKFRTEEVISYLEDSIKMNTATAEEMELYEDYMYSGKMKKLNHTYKQVIFKMRDEWNIEF